MKHFCKNILLVISFLLILNVTYSQSGEIKIRFIGNCGLHLTDGSFNIYVDFPYKSGAHRYMQYDNTELDSIKNNSIFIFTHRHTDHYSDRLVRRIKKDYNGKVYGNWNIKKLNEINSTVNEFSIQAIQTSHLFTIKHYSYLMIWHNKKFYFSGDTGNLNELSKLKQIDWAFINPWLLMNARNEKVAIDAKMFGVYHLYPFQKLPEQVPDNVLFLKKQGEVITVPY